MSNLRDNVHARMLMIWNLYVSGEYDLAFDCYSRETNTPDAAERDEIVPYLRFFRPFITPLCLKEVIRADPFSQRCKWPRGSITLKYWDEIVGEKTNNHRISKDRMNDFFQVIQEKSPAESFEFCFWLHSMSGCLRIELFEQAKGCLLKAIELAEKLLPDVFDFAVACNSLGEGLGTGILSYGEQNNVATDAQYRSTCMNLLKFDFESCLIAAAWLRKLVLPEGIPYDLYTKSNYWIGKAFWNGLSYVHLAGINKNFSDGSAMMDELLIIGHNELSLARTFCFDPVDIGIVSKYKDAFDSTADPEMRKFLLREFLRFQRLFVENDHHSVKILETELFFLQTGSMSPSQQTVNTASSLKSRTSKIDKIRTEAFATIEKRQDVSALLQHYVESNWMERFQTEDIVVIYHARGLNSVQFDRIDSPRNYSDTLTPEKVLRLIDVVNSACGKIHVGLENGSKHGTITIRGGLSKLD
ncbi:MAG: hypothetical protein K2X81_06670 [Candidatus Obscuribacterales bacterium]|nr:hypothetical protein [Candidatus Obscuribacterales bacterium]